MESNNSSIYSNNGYEDMRKLVNIKKKVTFIGEINRKESKESDDRNTEYYYEE